MEILKNILCGAVVGVANIIPGVSGGTMAVVLNIFDRLMEALSLKNLRKNIWFLLTVGIGAAVGIIAFSNAITYLLDHYPVATNFAFLGLIAGSLPMIFKRASSGGKLRVGQAVAFVAALAVMVALGFANQQSGASESYETVLTVQNFFFLFFAAAVSTFAMILPGISGSLVMLLFGVYYTVINAIKDFNLFLLLPVALGVALGLVFGSKLVSILIKRWPHATYAAILGLILGSLFSILPGFVFDLQGLCAIVLTLALAGVAYLFSTRQAE